MFHFTLFYPEQLAATDSHHLVYSLFETKRKMKFWVDGFHKFLPKLWHHTIYHPGALLYSFSVRNILATWQFAFTIFYEDPLFIICEIL